MNILFILSLKLFSFLRYLHVCSNFLEGYGNPELKNRVTDYDVIDRVELNCDVNANFLSLGTFCENKISELRNSEILSLFNNTKIPELRNSRI